MQSIVKGEHMRQQAQTGPPALDRAGWQRRLSEAIAARAGHAGPNDPVHDKAARCPAAVCLQTVRGRDVFQFLGHILAQAAQFAVSGPVSDT